MNPYRRQVEAIAAEYGATVESAKRNRHLKVTLPNGKVVFTSSNPSDFRSIKNFKAQVRREAK